MTRTYFLLALAVVQSVIGWNTWKGLPSADQLDQVFTAGTEVSYGAAPENYPIDYQSKIKNLGITLHPGTEFNKNSKSTKTSLNHCSAIVYGTLKAMPGDVTKNLKDLTLYFTATGRRGLGGGSTIILRCQNVEDQELASVLVHELGHIMDTGVMEGHFWSGESEFHDGKNSIYNDDLSLDFYRISFENEKKLKTGVSNLDFVSGYAKTDPFEDFAETYNYYLLHGDNFRLLAEHNQVLADKYNFMKERVFQGQEFNFESAQEDLSQNTRSYDSTTIGYNLEKFLAI